MSETANGVTSAYAYPATSNRLTSVTPAGQSARTFAYDASGDIVTDTRTGGLGMSFEYDVEGRLSKAWQTNAPSQGATYAYDAVAIVDKVDTATPAIYYVHTDHLGRPARLVLAQYWHWAWDVAYGPFGEVAGVWADLGVTQDMRFPGQWFQMESGLAYNWHRHYDATLGRYVQPDPLRVDEREGETVGGVTSTALEARSSLIEQIFLSSGATRFGAAVGVTKALSPKRAHYPDGSSVYGYSTQNPLAKLDPRGLSVSLSGDSFSARQKNRDVCLAPESGTDHYVKCQESNNKKIFAPGWRCGDCHFYCTGVGGGGVWPFQFCPY